MQTIINEIYDIINDKQYKKVSLYKIYWILLAIKWRYKKYWEIWISKKEFKKFKISEWKLYSIIKILIAYWFLEFKRTARNKEKQICFVYNIWKDFVEEFIIAIRNFSNNSVKLTTISEKITEWCKKTNIIDFIDEEWYLYWIKFKKRSQKKIEDWIYCNQNIIKDFKKDKSYNLFNYILEYTGFSCYELALKLKIIW